LGFGRNIAYELHAIQTTEGSDHAAVLWNLEEAIKEKQQRKGVVLHLQDTVQMSGVAAIMDCGLEELNNLPYSRFGHHI
jgi:hypothetical protein